ncbi:protodermal factor 1 [Syzygium oleosum]|uniref:protodermal factor 1 n=1 Tax=Syzygium oleosum TaxID=219896 RepID=UPI0011D2B70D|nr:protodermal factor 1 [Syzygium oleosum]
MARREQVVSSFMGGCVMVVGWSLLLQSFLLAEVTGIEFEDEKNYCSPSDPRAGSPPSGSRGHGSPPRVTSPPPYWRAGTPPPPYHVTPSHPTPPTPARYCGNPPQGHDPTRSTPPPRGGYYRSPPTSGGRPRTPVILTPPATPIDPGTPSTPTTIPPPTGGYYPSPPTSRGGSTPTPVISTPPATPIDPGTPSSPSVPAPPFSFGPYPNPFTRPYTYWLSNPGMVWGVFGWWVPMRTAFRVPTTIPGIPATLNLIQALSNTSIDGLGALYREGTAALLNSIVNYRFPFTTAQVQRSFVLALGSDGAASSQAQLFKLANEGRLKPRAN